MSFIRYLDIVKQKYNFTFNTLKKEQTEIISSVLEKKDTLACLPTSFGKSLPYTLIPLLLDEVSIILKFWEPKAQTRDGSDRGSHLKSRIPK